MSDFIIRKFENKDKNHIEHISWQVQEWERQYYPGRALSGEIICKHVNRLIAPLASNRGVILVAEWGDKCVGYIAGSINDDFLNTTVSFYINDMGVDKKYRGRGIGTALLSEIERVAKGEYKLAKMIIGVICGNDGAEKLYKRFGFIPYELELVKTI